CLSEDGKPSLVAGVPPDYFSEDGQLWGNPLYDWGKMKEDGYRWWRDRVSHMATLFDAIRIDHFRGIESYWAVPTDAKTAKEGSWKPGPGIDFIKAIREAAGEAQIIAEDLGDITPEVHALVKESGFPGMRVFQFGFLSYGDSLHKPHHYPKNSVAYTGTHDNNTLLGYLWELPDDLRKNMLLYCGHTCDWGNGCESMIRTVMASHADLAILPIQDLLGYGSDTRLNTPGKAEGNWQYRITKEQLDSIDKNYFRELNERYARI
ncbi:MAG: 4-alpha-glucanotransferase, partial [Clostridia bacterium]|nr:4-alpha-glucanotransferase [Clostridia bacterium]